MKKTTATFYSMLATSLILEFLVKLWSFVLTIPSLPKNGSNLLDMFALPELATVM